MSFFKTFVEYIKADKDIIKYRLDICQKCPFLSNNSRCSQCGCFMKIKTVIGPARCPVGKW